MKSNPYKISLERGKAKRHFHEMSPAEKKVAARRIFERAKRKATMTGNTPVTIHSLAHK